MGNVRLLLPVLGLAVGGCMPVFYHDLSRTPAVPAAAAGEAIDEVHAFRVQASESHWGAEGASSALQVRIQEVPFSTAGVLPRYWTCQFDYGWISLLGCEDITMNGTALRLYRPGFATVEIPPGGPPPSVSGKRATDWKEQEQALDALVVPPTLLRAREKYQATPADPLWINSTPAYTKALIFVADEYERIAALVPDSHTADRQRLAQKSQRFRAASVQILPLQFRPRPPYP